MNSDFYFNKELLDSCKEQGTIERFDYETNTYDEEARPMKKYGYVYLPYGYQKEKAYNICYIMHGGGGSAELHLGGIGGDRPLKRILDQLIFRGEMEPLIFVSPSYYHDNRATGMEAKQTATFYHELLHDLIPAVESKYHTYAETVDENGIRASRRHRIFGGFSMGAATTWHVFSHCLDQIAFYMPISGDCWSIGEFGGLHYTKETARFLHQAVLDSGYKKNDFAIYAMNGSEDLAYPKLTPQIEAMKAYSDTFEFCEDFSEGNLSYCVAEGGYHDYDYMIQYIARALPVLCKCMD